MGSNDQYTSILQTFHDAVEGGVHLLSLVIGQQIVSQQNQVKTILRRLVQQLVSLPMDTGAEPFVYQPGSPTGGL